MKDHNNIKTELQKRIRKIIDANVNKELGDKLLQELTQEIFNYHSEFESRNEELKKKEKELFESKEDLRTTLNSIGDAIIATDTLGKITRMNPISEKLTGWKFEDAKQKQLRKVFRIVDAEENKEVENPVNEVLRNGKVVDLANHTKLLSRDGNEYHIADSAAPIKDHNGEITGVVLVFRDITEEYRIKEILTENEKRYRAVFENTGAATCILESDGTITLANAQFEDLSGYSIEEIEGKKKWMEFVVKSDLERMWEQHKLRREDSGKALKQYEFRFVDKNGNVKNIYLIVDVIPGSNKSVASLLDVTKLKEAEARIKESEEQFRTLFEQAADGILVGIGKGEIVEANDSMCRLTGYNKEELIGENISKLFPQKVLKSEPLRYDLVEKGESVLRERVMRRKDGKSIQVEMSTKILGDGRMQALFRDVTDRKRFEDTMKNLALSNAHLSGKEFFVGVCRQISEDLELDFVFVGQYYAKENAISILGGWGDGSEMDKIVYGLMDTPCNNVINKSTCVYEDNIKELFPNDSLLQEMDINGYIGAPLNDKNNNPLGILVGLRRKPLENSAFFVNYFKIYIERISSEILRANSEKELQRSEEEKAKILDSTLNGIYIYDYVKKTHEYINRAHTYLTGWTKDDLVEMGDGFYELIHPDERELLKNSLVKLKESKRDEPLQLKYRCRTKKGKWIWLLSYNVPFERDEDGNVTKIIGSFVDFTKQKEAEDQLILLSRSVEQSPVSIMITTPNGRIEYVNPSFTHVTGYSLEEVKGENPRILNSGHQPKSFYKHMWDTILSGNDWYGEVQNKKKNGQSYWEDIAISPILNGNNEISHFVSVREDVTEKKKMIEDLVNAKEKAEEMNRVKSYFFANMSHELRTPFVGIMGYSELLLETLKDPENIEMVEGILRISERMKQTLTKVLNLSKIEFDGMKVVRKKVNLNELLTTLENQFSGGARQKGLYLKQEMCCDICSIETDGSILLEILNNLVGNAINYTNDGGIKIFTEKVEEDNEQKLLISVQDTGIGIPKSKQKIIWEDFRQVSEGTTRQFQGTGLGLSIAKKYTELLGGKIYLESKKGVGSTFTVAIPI